MKSRNPYILLSIGLILAGVLFVPVAYILLESIPLSALGVSMVILGTVCFVLRRTVPSTSPEVSAIFLETSLENISALIKEIGLGTKAIYLPSSKTQGQHRALLPLQSDTSLVKIKKSSQEIHRSVWIRSRRCWSACIPFSSLHILQP